MHLSVSHNSAIMHQYYHDGGDEHVTSLDDATVPIWEHIPKSVEAVSVGTREEDLYGFREDGWNRAKRGSLRRLFLFNETERGLSSDLTTPLSYFNILFKLTCPSRLKYLLVQHKSASHLTLPPFRRHSIPSIRSCQYVSSLAESWTAFYQRVTRLRWVLPDSKIIKSSSKER